MPVNPAHIATQLQEAVAHHRAGRLNEAEKLYKRVLQVAPDQPDALRLMAGIALQTSRHSVAETFAKRALVQRPDNAELHRMLATALLERGKAALAAHSARRALELDPNFTPARLLLGNALHASGDLEGAEREWRDILAAAPDDVPTQYNLAQLLLKSGRNTEAQTLLENAAAHAHAHPGVLALLAEFKLSDKPALAITMLKRAIALGNKAAAVYLALGRALRLQGDYFAARAALDEAVKLDRKNVEALIELAEACRQAEQFDQALEHLRRAKALDPKNSQIMLKIGDLLDLVWRNDEALAFLKSHASVNAMIGSGYCFRSNLSTMTPADIFAAHKSWANRFAVGEANAASLFVNDRNPNRRLRVGYVSGDFRHHAVTQFALPLLKAHDQNRIELFAFSNVEKPDAVTEQIRTLPLVWRNIFGLDDSAAENLVRQDRIDILVDLSGHTAFNRLGLFTRRAAPVQITYLGYPNTSAIAAMDYRVVDAITDPAGLTEQFNTERLLRVPSGFLCFAPPKVTVDIGPLPLAATGHVTFGSTNNLAKINSPTIAAWARILNAVPNSRLLLKDRRVAFAEVRRRIHAAMAKFGIAPERIELEEFTVGGEGHLEFYNRIDIALDPFPYNGTTTSFETLWMGVPVIVLAGDRHVGRVGMSILHHIQVPQLAAETVDQYVDLAIKLAGDSDHLTDLRATLRGALLKSPLCDPGRLAREIETLYRETWRHWCATSR